MTDTETVSPGAEQAVASEADEAAAAELAARTATEGEGDAETQDKPKPEKSPEQKAIERLERKLGRVIGQREEARAEREQLRQAIASLQGGEKSATTRAEGIDNDKLSLTRAEFQAAVEAEAKKLAPTIKGQEEETAKRREVVSGLAKLWGQDAFMERTNDLAEIVRDGDKQLLVLEADNPAALIEYLTDDDHADEAEAIARLPLGKAGYALAKLSAKLAADKANDKPKPSKMPPPLESIRGQGGNSGAPDPSDTKAWIAWRNKQERMGL